MHIHTYTGIYTFKTHEYDLLEILMNSKILIKMFYIIQFGFECEKNDKAAMPGGDL